MTNKHKIARIETGVRNLDALLRGGLPRGSVSVISGAPGAGKTILAQQICFHNALPSQRALYFSTLSEPTAKTLLYLSQFDFFDAGKLGAGIEFVDLGSILRTQGLEKCSQLVMEHIKRVRPALVVVDSFRSFDDLAETQAEFRKFGYELAVNLMAWETTVLLLGEYGPNDIGSNPLFSIVDGLISLTQRERSGEQQRFIQIVKTRGTEHVRDEHPFVITSNGLEVFAARATIRREDRGRGAVRCKTGLANLDTLLGEGIPRGSSLLVGGVAGTGKTVLLLEFIYRGALAGEQGIVFSFEETEERLRATARGLGWDLDGQIERGMVEIVFTPQPEIMVEGHLLMMRERVEAVRAKRVAIDSVSVFLHKVVDPQVVREKVFQLASIVQNVQAVGFFAADIPYGSTRLSRFGVEETVVDGVVLLTAKEEGLERRRYIEIYKLRNTAHLKGRHNMSIGPSGITVFPRYCLEGELDSPPPPVESSRRVAAGVPGLDELCGGGLLERSVTLVSGSSGIGKTTLGLQFIVEGVKRGEPGIYVALEEGPAQLLAAADSLALSLREATESGLVELVYLSREHVRASQLVAILADRIQAKKTRRLVFDSVSHIATHGAVGEELRQLLYALIVRFKVLGVTSVLTLESSSMFSADTITDLGLSPIADNIIVLRYVQSQGELRPSLTVVKTRSSPHDWGTHYFTISQGGIRIGERATRGNAVDCEETTVRRGPVEAKQHGGQP
jgi:circadian clock protein KaiC